MTKKTAKKIPKILFFLLLFFQHFGHMLLVAYTTDTILPDLGVPQSRLALGHHKNIGSAPLIKSKLTKYSLAAGYKCLRQLRVFFPLKLTLSPWW